MASKTFVVPIQAPDAWRFDDVEAASVLPRRKAKATALRALFSETELRELTRRRAAIGPRTVAFLSYENPWGTSGGIAAVAKMLPRELAAAGEQVVRISPLHSSLKGAAKPEDPEPCGKCSVRFGGSAVPVAIFRATEENGDWYLFGADGHFDADGGAGGNDPHVFSDETRADRDGDGSKLLRDALFAAAAIPQVLATLVREGRIGPNLVVHAQDWELASVALTVKDALLDGRLDGVTASVVLTLHNPYDHRLSDEGLRRITQRAQPERWPLVERGNQTILARMIPLADAAISTVSRRFAQEFTTDPLQTGHFARHLQTILAGQGLIGIDNGLFAAMRPDPAYDQAIDLARRDKTGPILEAKRAARVTALRRLQNFLVRRRKSPKVDEPVFGSLDGGAGRALEDLPDEIPVFMMTGRLDPGQKGFDVFAGAIERLPEGLGRYIISPLSPMSFDPDIRRHLDYLARLAKRRPGEVLVLPFRLDEIYADLMKGVTWSVWPSLYEPFGGVTEPYLWRTPVIARATGGLVQQVMDYGLSPADATGILYRESVPASRHLQETAQRAMQEAIDPNVRQGTALFEAQAGALAEALASAAKLYRDRPADYGCILANLPDMCRRLDWGQSVRIYRRWYDSASARPQRARSPRARSARRPAGTA